MNFTVSFAPLLPLLWLSILGVAGLVLIAISAFARTRGWWLRGLALALLLASLSNPTLRHEDREALNDIAVAVIDRSQSQLAGERMKQADEAEAALKSAAATLGNTELRVVTVQSGLNPQEDGTRLFTALNRALSDIPPERFAGALMVTDGQVHDVPPDAAKSGINGPVHGLLTGSQTERDRRVVIEQAPRFGIVGNAQILRFRVDDVGGGGEPIDVTLKLGTGEPQSLTVTAGRERRSSDYTRSRRAEHRGDCGAPDAR